MGERKVINKYIPADFDPSLIPRGKKLSSKDGTVPVRMMLPFSMQCDTCHTFLYRGRKFNSKKEPVQGSAGKYLGIQRFRFYIKCSHCSRPISFLTDPQNADYEMETGATRNFELHRNTKKEVDEDNPGPGSGTHNNPGEEEDDNDDGGGKPSKEQQQQDPMKALENRVLESQREMADLDNLEEIKAMNAQHSRMDPLQALHKKQFPSEQGDLFLSEQEEALIRSIQFGSSAAASNRIQRLTEQDEQRMEEQRRTQSLMLGRQQDADDEPTTRKRTAGLPAGLVVVPKKKKQNPATTSTNATPATARVSASNNKNNNDKSSQSTTDGGNTGLAGLLGEYGSDSE